MHARASRRSRSPSREGRAACRSGDSRDPTLRLQPLPALRCDDRVSETSTELVAIPPLVESYLGFGAKICSRPALDLAFKVVDFFVILDLSDLEPAIRRSFFEKNVWSEA